MPTEEKQIVSVQMTREEVEALEEVRKRFNLDSRSDAIRRAVSDSVEEDAVLPINLEAIEEATKPVSWWEATEKLPKTSSSENEAAPDADIWRYRLLRDKTPIVAGSIGFYVSFTRGRGYDIVLPAESKASKKLKESILAETEKLIQTLNFQTRIGEYVDVMLTEGFCPVEILKQNGMVYGWNFIGTDNLTIIHDPNSFKVIKYKVKPDKGDPVFFNPDDVMMLEWNKRVGDFFGTSLLKAVMQTLQWLLNIEKAYAKGVFRYGNPIIIFIAKNWGKPQLKKFEGYLKKRSEEGIGSLVVTGDVQVQEIRPSQEVMSRRDALNHFIDMVAIGFCVPNVLYNVRSTSQESAGVQWQVFLERINDIRHHVAERFTESVLKPHLQAVFPEASDLPIPTIIWNDLKSSDPEKRITNLIEVLRIEYTSPVFRIAVEQELADALDISVDEVMHHWDEYQEYYKGAIPPVLPAAQKAETKPTKKTEPLKTKKPTEDNEEAEE